MANQIAYLKINDIHDALVGLKRGISLALVTNSSRMTTNRCISSNSLRYVEINRTDRLGKEGHDDLDNP